MEYFSDKVRGHRPRTEESITPTVWGGIVAFIQSLIQTGALGYQFPELCPNGAGKIGTDQGALSMALQAEISGIDWPLQTQKSETDSWETKPFAPNTLSVFDLVEFCYKNSAKPIQGYYHSHFQHHHITFNVQAGREEFRERINTLFSRNGLAYELNINGSIVRLAPPVLQETLIDAIFRTGDDTLDQMLEETRRKFLNPDVSLRREAVERLWDAWERIKTLDRPDNKKLSIELLLNNAARGPEALQLLEDEAKKLTDIGNSFHIRHSEIAQTRISDSDHLDYLFHRLFCMILLLLRKR